jgi:hypothetical protein
LLVGQPPGGPEAARLPHRGQAVAAEGVEVGINGVGMGLHQGGDVGGDEARRVEQNDLGTAALPGGEWRFKELVQQLEFGNGRLADRQGS